MGLWQNLVAGYDENAQALSDEYPLSTTIVSNKSEQILVLTLAPNGKYKAFRTIPKCKQKEAPQHFVIPVSSKSMGRAGKNICAHPLFDQRMYVFGKTAPTNSKSNESERKTHHDDYCDDYHTKLKAFSDYFETNKTPNDVNILRSVLLFIESEEEKTRFYENFKHQKKTPFYDEIKEKVFVLFEVEIPGVQESKLWKMPNLFQRWHQFCLDKDETLSNNSLDFITGTLTAVTSTHPKKLFTSAANAKLISSNDGENYTYRGRFSTDASESVTIGYNASQKAHQYLRYLITNQGIICSPQVIVPFTIHDEGIKNKIKLPVRDDDFDFDDDDDDVDLSVNTGKIYADVVRKAIEHGKRTPNWQSHSKSAIAIFEAATDGRLSVTFYREMQTHDYLERIQAWHTYCEWPLTYWNKEKQTFIPYIGAPSIDRILSLVYGDLKDDNFKKMQKKGRELLIRTIFDNGRLPTDYIAKAINRISNPLSFTDSKGSFEKHTFLSAVRIACSLIKHDLFITEKKETPMSIDLTCKDRDYLYGRLLGAADTLEEYALRKKQNDRIVTAAIRHMQTFSQRPYSTWTIIHDTLIPYIQTVKNSFSYHEIEKIMTLFECNNFETDTPLSGKYLIGYYHERAYIEELIKSKTQSTTEEE